jgi:integrase
MKRKGTFLNPKGFPYIPAKLKKKGWRIHIEYYVFSIEKNDLVRKRVSKFMGKTPAEKLKDAQTMVHKINRLLSSGYIIGKPTKKVQKALSIKEAMEFAVKTKSQTIGKTTRGNYRSFSKIFYKYLRENKKLTIPVKEFDQAQIYFFFDWLFEERKVGNRTRNNYKDFLNAMFNQLIDRKVIDENPVKGIKDLPTMSNINIPFTKKEEEILKKYLKEKMPELYLFTRFIYFGFLRPVEICRLRIKHIDLENHIILVRPHLTKNKKQLPVVITSQLEKYIKQMNLDDYPPHWHVFSKGLKPGPEELYETRVSEMHRKALEETGLYNEELTMYSWKHTGNCNAYRAGVDIKSIQAQNRHHSLQMTEIYLRSLGLRLSKDLKNIEW